MGMSEARKRKVKIYVWKYDDGAWGYAVRDKSEERSWTERQDETNMLAGMQALLNSCGTTPDAQRDMLCLVASVLSG